MPRHDGTGPAGKGPLTGRGLGTCEGAREDTQRLGFGQGLGRGRGPGRGRRCGPGRGSGRGFWRENTMQPNAPEQANSENND